MNIQRLISGTFLHTLIIRLEQFGYFQRIKFTLLLFIYFFKLNYPFLADVDFVMN